MTTSKRTYKNRLVVKGQMPEDAHQSVPLDTPEQVYSTHTTTRRGLRAAMRQKRILLNSYRESHTSLAACRVWIELNGQRFNADILDIMATDLEIAALEGKPLPVNPAAFIETYSRLCEDLEEARKQHLREQEAAQEEFESRLWDISEAIYNEISGADNTLEIDETTQAIYCWLCDGDRPGDKTLADVPDLVKEWKEYSGEAE